MLALGKNYPLNRLPTAADETSDYWSSFYHEKID
jgi:hypothetical protein